MALKIDKRINNTLILSLGGNIGNVKAVLKDAIIKIEEEVGVVKKKSSIYKTAAWGVEEQPDFLNQVIVAKTSYSPFDCITKVLAIELALGRVRNGKKWCERLIDIDILFYNDNVIDTPKLKIPHPYIQNRNFILFPLAEIVSDFTHPLLNKTIFELKNECEDKLDVIKAI